MDSDPLVVSLEEDLAEAALSAFSSSTARQLLMELYEEPQTASDLADQIDSSIQNVRYHLTKLQERDLVEVVDTWYSSRGKEMDVYAPAGDPLVVVAGVGGRDSVSELATGLAD